ncbi:hypothetical protein NDU88_006371 [Pleurodeles waltl]|uniref:Uncharacterized protein n=1 Tax=Pleurodeles waltl TaxID=8319 RepID=A0AAV7SPN3_PLEWA|nr:hypothetical protein NDU88_006371 [Pleurodeles waltl]
MLTGGSGDLPDAPAPLRDLAALRSGLRATVGHLKPLITVSLTTAESDARNQEGPQQWLYAPPLHARRLTINDVRAGGGNGSNRKRKGME